jgi:hypothetical protein
MTEDAVGHRHNDSIGRACTQAWRGKVPFSAFKRVVIDGFKQYEPDRLLIEKKASGISLIQRTA